MNQIYFKSTTTPIGELIIVASDKGICWVGGEDRFKKASIWIQKVINASKITEDKSYPLLIEAEKQLINYFAGKLKVFTLPLDLYGTEFQKKVWKAISEVSFGETITYAKLALKADNPQAVRAVGTICGLNPIIIFIPCHRVIGSNGKLTGFIEGLEAKKLLLNIEKETFQAKLF